MSPSSILNGACTFDYLSLLEEARFCGYGGLYASVRDELACPESKLNFSQLAIYDGH